MAIKQFAVPLDGNSTRPGDAHFQQLANAGAAAEFEITNVSAGAITNELNLITSKGGHAKDHKFTPTFGGGSAKVSLSAANLSAIYSDANGGDWDYVETKWTVGQTDTPSASILYIHQSGQTFNIYGW